MCARALVHLLNDAETHAQQGCAMQFSGITLTFRLRDRVFYEPTSQWGARSRQDHRSKKTRTINLKWTKYTIQMLLTLKNYVEGTPGIYVRSWKRVVLHSILNLVCSWNPKVVTVSSVGLDLRWPVWVVRAHWTVPWHSYESTFPFFDNVTWAEATGWQLYIWKWNHVQ